MRLVLLMIVLAGLGAVTLLVQIPAEAQESAPAPRSADADQFRQVQRPGSVNIEKEYDLSNLSIPKDQIHTLLPRDAIPALTDPKLEPVAEAKWLPDDARIIAVTVGDETIGVPLRVLDWHEIVNLTIGGEPVAVTYCPLCDSATVFSRRVKQANGDPAVLEFGVSGALFNSNVLMYDRRDKGLWSQLGMQAVSGPLAGTSLDMLPVRLVSAGAFRKAHAKASIVSRETGHQRDYGQSPYESYFAGEGLMVPVAKVGDALPRKTLGLGVAVGEQAWFVPADAIGQEFALPTPAGVVRVKRTEAGVAVAEAPAAARTAQTFYYSWSAFFPQTQVVRSSADAETAAPAPGLPVGTKAPGAALLDVHGKSVQLADLYKNGPIVLTFYRGGWCPICNRALAGWQNRLEDVRSAGGTFIALTPEKPDEAARTIEKGHLAYTVLSDPRHEAAKAFKVHFAVDDATREKYLGYGMDVGKANVSGTWELPAPATFVIDREGVIRYAFADWDYTKRADPDEVIRVLEALPSAG